MASAKEIPPGGEGKIDITFKTGSGSGKREKHIAVTTNDPDNKNISLTISTAVVEKIGITPDRVNFSQVKKGKEHVRYASISGEDKDTTKLTGFDSPNPNIKAEINPKGYDGNKDQQVKIILLPTIRAGRFFDRVIFHTDHKDVKDISVNVIGEVTGDISLMPSQLHFGLFQAGQPADRVITVKATENATFKILEVKSSVPEVTTSVETVTAGKQSEYRIHAHLSDKFTGDSLKGTLTIKTDLKEDSTLDIDIVGRKLSSVSPGPAGANTETHPPVFKDGQLPPPVAGGAPGSPPPNLPPAPPGANIPK